MIPKCDLCDDVGKLHLRGKCHPTAPLRAEFDKGILSLYCYVPECNRLVAKLCCLPVEDIDVSNIQASTN